jgi:ribonuclease HII
VKRTHIVVPDLSHEEVLWKAGWSLVGGIDEAGRGAWAGPVFAAVVILAAGGANSHLLGNVRDSKQMTPAQRKKWTLPIKQLSLDWGVAHATNEEIDKLGIVPATQLAAKRALLQLKTMPDYLLLDYLKLPDVSIQQEALVRGDQKVLSIAAASILAKTARDDYMVELGRVYPAYSFYSNKGYGTAAHQQAIIKSGICCIHRVCFKPIARMKNRPHKND